MAVAAALHRAPRRLRRVTPRRPADHQPNCQASTPERQSPTESLPPRCARSRSRASASAPRQPGRRSCTAAHSGSRPPSDNHSHGVRPNNGPCTDRPARSSPASTLPVRSRAWTARRPEAALLSAADGAKKHLARAGGRLTEDHRQIIRDHAERLRRVDRVRLSTRYLSPSGVTARCSPAFAPPAHRATAQSEGT